MIMISGLSRIVPKSIIIWLLFVTSGLLLEPPDSTSRTLKINERDYSIAWGKILARDNCGRCHAIDIEGTSPNKTAPPFWQMAQTRDVDTISDMLVNKTAPKHKGMPNFHIPKLHADHLAAWIAWIQPLAHGKRLVEHNCSRCHAVTKTDGSRHPDAPPFRTLSKFYPVDALEEAFAEGIVTGHPDMPVFVMTELQLTDVIAYLETIQDKQSAN